MAEVLSGLMLTIAATFAVYTADFLASRVRASPWPGRVLVVIAATMIFVGSGAIAIWIADAGSLSKLPIALTLSGLILLAAATSRGRKLVARILPLDRDRMRDWVGLVIILWLVVLRLMTFSGDADEEFGEVSLLAAALQTAVFLGIAAGTIGVFVRRDWRSSLERLGLHRISARSVAIGAGAVIPVILLGGLTVLLVEYLAPGSTNRLDETVTEITGGDTSLGYGLALGIFAAAGEETLFRGALQPRYGLVFTSLAFAVLHAQYDLLLIVASLFPVGLIFGLERKYLGTYACIVTHALYNTLAVVLG